MVTLDPELERYFRRRTIGAAVSALVIGFLFGAGLVTYWYDPSLFGLKPTVENPRKPNPPADGSLVVDPLAKEWDFGDADVPWAPLVPLAQISDSAYMEGQELEATLNKWGFAVLEEVANGSMYGYVASNDDVVVVAFRGTSDPVDWLTNVDILSVELDDGRAHRGFYQASSSLLSATKRAAGEQGMKEKKLWITGHSLGGALALLFAYESVREGVQPAGVVTFGQPMVVDGGLGGFLNQKLSGRYVRLVNGGDIVPRMVPRYSHCGNLVWFTGDSYQFIRPAVPKSAKATKADELEEPLEYLGGPEPLTLEEFEKLRPTEVEKSERLFRRKGRQTIDRKAGAPAALQDHYMPGYLHWVSVFSEREQSKPVSSAAPTGVGSGS